MAVASQKLVSRKLLTYKSFHNNLDIAYNEIELIFFMNSIAKPHVKRLSVFHNSWDISISLGLAILPV